MKESPLYNAACLHGDGFYWRSYSIEHLERDADFHEGRYPDHIVKVFYPTDDDPVPSWDEIAARMGLQRPMW